MNPNPLATNPQPATAGTSVSLLNLDVRPAALHYRGMSVTSLGHASIQEHPNEDTSRDPTLSGSEGRANSSDAPVSLGSAPAFGEGTALLATQNLKDASKRKKPKNNMTKSNSSFISRVIVHETLSKRIQERPADGLYVFANINRAFQWLDLSAPNKADYMTKVLFTKAHCLCHDVNQVTKGANHIDVIMGFSTGEIIWWEATSQRYARLNKNGVINGTPVSQIKWIPGSENLFLAAHMDGSLVVYDKEREDAIFSPEQEGRDDGEAEAPNVTNGAGSSKNGIQVQKSVNSKNQKFNPVAAWKLSNQRINAFAFSPDNRHLAVVSEDGSLRIIDYLKEQYETLVWWCLQSKLTLCAGSSIISTHTTVASSASAGHQTASTSLLAGRMTSSRYGTFPNPPSSPGARATIRGSHLSRSTPGDATTRITALAASARTAGCACGTLALACCTGREEGRVRAQPLPGSAARSPLGSRRRSSRAPRRRALRRPG